MTKQLILLIFLIFLIKLRAQEVKVVNQENELLLDCLVLCDNGQVGQLNQSTKSYSFSGLSYPIAIHSYGFNSFTLQNESEVVKKIVLTRLSDSLSSVNVVSNRISAEESLKKILKNTTALYTPPDTLFQDFTYLLLSAAKDTLAHAKGLVSRDVGASWNEEVEIYIDTISDFFLDSTRAELLSKMWPSIFIITQKKSFITSFINEENASWRRLIEVYLDSIVKQEGFLTFFLWYQYLQSSFWCSSR